MQVVKYFSTGGQDERGRYSGVLEIEDNLFILDAGLGTRLNDEFGIKKVIPDFRYLATQKDRIKGIFLGTPKYLNIGSLVYMLDALGNIPIYTSFLGKQMVELFLGKKKAHIIVSTPLNELIIGQVSIYPFQIANSIPESLGWIFNSEKSGSVVFIDEFVISNEQRPGYVNQLCLISKYVKQKTKLLIIGAQNAGKVTSFAFSPSQNFISLKNSISSWTKRIVMACYEDDFVTLLNLSRISKIYSLNFHIASTDFAELFNSYVQGLNSDKYAFSSNFLTTSNSLVVMVGTEDTLYHNLKQLLKDTIEKTPSAPVILEKDDLFICETITPPTKELEEINILNDISSLEIPIIKHNKKIHAFIAGDEDIKYVVNLLNPSYIVPVNGYYKDFINVTIALENTCDTNKVKLLYTGEVLEIEEKGNSIKQLPISEQYAGKDGVVNISNVVILERQLMTRGGIVLVSVVYNHKQHNVFFGGCEIMGLFVANSPKKTKAIENITAMVKEEISKYLTQNKTLEIKKMKIMIKRAVIKALHGISQKKPAIVPVVSHFNKPKTIVV